MIDFETRNPALRTRRVIDDAVMIDEMLKTGLYSSHGATQAISRLEEEQDQAPIYGRVVDVTGSLIVFPNSEEAEDSDVIFQDEAGYTVTTKSQAYDNGGKLYAISGTSKATVRGVHKGFIAMQTIDGLGNRVDRFVHKILVATVDKELSAEGHEFSISFHKYVCVGDSEIDLVDPIDAHSVDEMLDDPKLKPFIRDVFDITHGSYLESSDSVFRVMRRLGNLVRVMSEQGIGKREIHKIVSYINSTNIHHRMAGFVTNQYVFSQSPSGDGFGGYPVLFAEKPIIFQPQYFVLQNGYEDGTGIFPVSYGPREYYRELEKPDLDEIPPVSSVMVISEDSQNTNLELCVRGFAPREYIDVSPSTKVATYNVGQLPVLKAAGVLLEGEI